MLAFRVRAALPILLSVAATAVAGAQQKQCEIDENKFAKTVFALQRVNASKTPEDAAKQLKGIVTEITTQTGNPVERNYLLGQALAAWARQPGYGGKAQRGALGYTTNPTDSIDVVAAMDTAFTAVETAKPECVNQTMPYRRSDAWVKVINAAVEAVNADKIDSAEALARRSLGYFKSPYAYNVLGNVAQKRNNNRQAIDYYKQFYAVAQNDTAFNDNRRQVLLVIGNLATDEAQRAQGADKEAFVRDAKWAYETLKAEKGANNSDLAQQGLARLALVSGDTASLKASYQAQLSNPGSYNYTQLMTAAVSASQANDVADATKLFEAAYAQNPYHRDVLANLAVMYIKQDQHAKALPFIEKLVEVDPSNGENYRLFTFAYAGMQKALRDQTKAVEDLNKGYGKKANSTTNARLKKAYIDSASMTSMTSARARALSDSTKHITDLALKYNTIADSLPVKVSFTEFSPTAEKATLGGTITNNSSSAQTYTMTVEFLDKTGKAVATQTANVGPVKPGEAAKFAVTGTAAGISAFRYAPLAKVAKP